jgi:CheY-like chemotaxis protein
MDSIGTLAGGISHDFNNLLTIINGLSEISLRKIKKNNPIHRDLKSIHAAGKKAEELTRKLLAFSRKQIIYPKIIDINLLISDLDKMLRRLIREDIKIEKKLFPHVLHIKADPSQIEQILINLVVNARDAISDRKDDNEKRIEISTKRVKVDQSLASDYPDSKPGNYILISVGDTGIGMNKATIEKIFEPFFTTKEKEHGTGLGMATVYGIIIQNKGFIKVKSEPGAGSTFDIYWPSADKELSVDDSLTEDIPEDESLRGKEHILTVEDDKDVRYFTRFALKNLGYAVTEASSGMEAIEIFKNSKSPKSTVDKIDMVITDLIMPGMNGKELAEKIKKMSKKIKILYTSGYEEAYIDDKDIINGDANFLQKPYTIKMLAIKVREVLNAD